MRISDWSSDVCSSDLLVRQRATEDEAACFDAHHLVDARAGKRLYHLVDGLAEAARILQQGGDVAESDTRLRISRAGPDLVLDPLHGRPEARRVRKGCVRTCGSRWAPEH